MANLSDINQAGYVPEKEKEVHYRIDDSAGVALLFFAFFFYILGIIPGVNVLVDIIGNVLFFIWFNFFLNVPTFGQRTWMWYLAAWVVELIPFISIIPIEVIMVFRIIAISRIEDRLAASGISQTSLASEGARNIGKGIVEKMEGKFGGQSIKNKDGSVNTEKEKARQERLGERRKDLDTALSGKNTPDSRTNLLTKNLDRQPAFRQKTSSGNQPVDGVVPQSANDNAPDEGREAA